MAGRLRAFETRQSLEKADFPEFSPIESGSADRRGMVNRLESDLS